MRIRGVYIAYSLEIVGDEVIKFEAVLNSKCIGHEPDKFFL